MPDINELAEKKLKSRVRKIKKVNKSDEEKEKFFVQLGASVEIFFPNKKPEELSDSLILWTTPEGKITDAEYSYEEPENEQFVQMPVPEKDLKAFVEAFKDFLTTSPHDSLDVTTIFTQALKTQYTPISTMSKKWTSLTRQNNTNICSAIKI